MLVAAPLATPACVGRTAPTPFGVTIRGSTSACNIEVGGKKVTTDELLVLGRSAVKSAQRAYVEQDMAEVPWRCVAGVIYALQMAGFKIVSVTGRER